MLRMLKKSTKTARLMLSINIIANAVTIGSKLVDAGLKKQIIEKARVTNECANEYIIIDF
jgi:hypothetical protein